jgi:hypothetical protein
MLANLGVYARVAMLFDPNRWPKPYPMLGSPHRVAVAVIALVVVSIALIVGLPALADWLANRGR